MLERQTMFTPCSRTDGLERVDLLDWDELHETVQSVLQDLDKDVRGICQKIEVKPGRNSATAWNLFSYRVYRASDKHDIDPVVVGIVCASTNDGITIRGDIAGETIGDVLFEAKEKHVVEKSAAIKAAREIAQQLAEQGGIIAKAVHDPMRIA